jgi:hypothetical protein
MLSATFHFSGPAVLWFDAPARGICCRVRLGRDGDVTARGTAPVLRRFYGQPFRNLVGWAGGGCVWHPIRVILGGGENG